MMLRGKRVSGLTFSASPTQPLAAPATPLTSLYQAPVQGPGCSQKGMPRIDIV